MIDRIIKFLYYSLVFFTPLIVLPVTSELFEFNKMLFIYATAILLLFLLTTKYIWQKKIRLAKIALSLPLLLFLASQVLSTLFSIDKHTSIYGYYGRFNGGLLSIIAYLILFYGFFEVGSVLFIKKLLKVSLSASSLVILWGLPGKFGYDLSCLIFTGQFNNSCWTDQFRPAERLFSTLGQPNWLGAYLAINFFVALYFFILSHGSKKFIYYLYLLLNFAVILFTRSRSAILAVILGFIFFFTFITIRQRRVEKKLAILALTIIFSVLFFKTGMGQIDRFLNLDYYREKFFSNKIAKIDKTAQTAVKNDSGGVTESLDIRKIVWDGAVKLGFRYPLFGTGVETFAYSYYFVRPEKHNLTSEWDYLYNKAHNEYLNYFATTGFVGLASYLLLLGTFLGWSLIRISNFKFLIFSQSAKLKNKNSLQSENYQLKTREDEPELLILCLFFSYLTILTTNFFGFSTTTINIFFYLIPAIILILANAVGFESISLTKLSAASSKILLAVNTLVFTILMLFLIFYFAADILYAEAEKYTRLGEYQKSVESLNLALKLHGAHVYEDKLSFVQANLAYMLALQKQDDLAKKFIQASDRLNVKAIMASPHNVLYWKTRAKNYFIFYQLTLDKNQILTGIEALNRARQLSPSDPKITYNLSIYYSILSDEEKDEAKKVAYQKDAFAYGKITINLKPDFKDARLLYAQLLKKYGRKNEAKQELELILKNFNPKDQEVLKELESLP